MATQKTPERRKTLIWTIQKTNQSIGLRNNLDLHMQKKSERRKKQ